ncbi:MAG: DUF503 domain-containing protein [Dehalococcoidia bacterium]|nr:DUF503 domain-containing protein [Dehalococcoidia bacterium]
MHVAICRVTLRLAENHSLKGKRHVVRSAIERVRARFNVSIAEVGEQDLWQTAVLGITTVNSDRTHAEETIARVVSLIENTARADAELLDVETEVTAF